MAVTLQHIFAQHFASFLTSHRLAPRMHRAAWLVQRCRTEQLGGRVSSCPEGHFHCVEYRSCRHRCCPQCSGAAKSAWCDRWKQRLLPVPHHHLVFTVPHELNALWRHNRRSFGNLLFAAASESLIELLGDGKYLGAKPGILAALHTWTQTLDIHLHLHVLVTAGGLDGQGQWRLPTRDCLLPRKVLMLKFRGKLLALLREAVSCGKLRLPPSFTRESWDRLTWQLRRAWNVKIFDSYDHGAGVVLYLAKYIRGGPIGNRRLRQLSDGQVHFRYRLGTRYGGDGRRQGVLKLPVEEFIARWLQHVPPNRMQTVRGYGLYSGNQHSQLGRAFEACQAAKTAVKDRERPAVEKQSGVEEPPARRCPHCGRTLVSQEVFAAGRGPPSLAYQNNRGWSAA